MCLITLELKDGENGGKLAQRCKIREESVKIINVIINLILSNLNKGFIPKTKRV